MKTYFFILPKDVLTEKILSWFHENCFYVHPHDQDQSKVLVFLSRWTQGVLKSKPNYIHRKIEPYFHPLMTYVIREEELQSIRKRVFFGPEIVQDDLPPEGVLEEVYLFLYVNRHKSVRYLGRGLEEDYTAFKDTVRFFEQYGRLRRYWFEINDYDPSKSLSFNQESYEALVRWFQDPDARVIISLGSGGLRLFSLMALLQFIETYGLLDHIHEVWGCSGGSLAGYLLAYRIPVRVFHELAYYLYSEAFMHEDSPFLKNTSTWLRKIWASGFLHNQNLKGVVDFGPFLDRILGRISSHAPQTQPIPFYVLAHNYTQKDNFVLANQDEPNYLKSFIRVHSNQALQIVKASSAVPIIFQRQVLVDETGQKEEWCDGVLYEDTPLATVIRKWQLDREHRPDQTPKKLKIFYVDIGLKMTDFIGPDSFFRIPLQVFFKSARTGVEILFRGSPHVDILGIDMELGFGGLLDPRKIPRIIHRGHLLTRRELIRLNKKLEKRTSS